MSYIKYIHILYTGLYTFWYLKVLNISNNKLKHLPKRNLNFKEIKNIEDLIIELTDGLCKPNLNEVRLFYFQYDCTKVKLIIIML